MMGFKDAFRRGFESAKSKAISGFESGKANIKERMELAKEERKADIESARMAKSEARQIRRSERAKQIKETARFKEARKGKISRERISSGGFLGGLLRKTTPMESGRTFKRTKKSKTKPQKRKSFLAGRKVNVGQPRKDLTRVGLNVDYLGKPRDEKPRKPMRFI